MSFEWEGDLVMMRVRKAAKYAIEKTMSECILHAMPNYYVGHGYVTGVLQGSIRMQEAEIHHDRVVGEWGSFDVIYAARIEKGFAKSPGQGQLQNAADVPR